MPLCPGHRAAQAQPSGGPVQTPEAGKSDRLGEGRFVCQSMMSFVSCSAIILIFAMKLMGVMLLYSGQ